MGQKLQSNSEESSEERKEQELDPLKIHFQMQEEALRAKKMKQQMIQNKRMAKMLLKQ